MQICLYIDEDAMSRALINGLRARGVDVKTALDMDKRKLDDEAQLKFATAQGRVLYTSNIGDFSRLHAEFLREGKSHSGIVFVPQQRYSFGEQIRRLLKLISIKPAEEMKNQIEFLSAWE